MENQAFTQTEEQIIEGGKFLTFFLDREEYAIEILKVMEIIGLMSITPVPSMPGYIRGILNLRGKIIPVMDIRSRFGLPGVDDTAETCIIILQQDQFQMGIVVDKVSEVAELGDTEIDDIPSFGAGITNDYLAGIGKVENTVKLILDVSRVLFEAREVIPESPEAAF